MNNKVRELCVVGLMTALTAAATMVLQIPVPGQGYIHLGDSVIFLTAVFFGRRYGAVAGGVGSAMADLLSGYAIWSPFTLVIKALMGFAVGTIACSDKGKSLFRPVNLLAVFVGIVIMIAGYFIAGGLINGSFLVALTSSTLPNVVQGAGGAIIYLIIGTAFEKVGIVKLLTGNGLDRK